jgi:hypothetical protein
MTRVRTENSVSRSEKKEYAHPRASGRGRLVLGATPSLLAADGVTQPGGLNGIVRILAGGGSGRRARVRRALGAVKTRGLGRQPSTGVSTSSRSSASRVSGPAACFPFHCLSCSRSSSGGELGVVPTVEVESTELVSLASGVPAYESLPSGQRLCSISFSCLTPTRAPYPPPLGSASSYSNPFHRTTPSPPSVTAPHP